MARATKPTGSSKSEYGPARRLFVGRRWIVAGVLALVVVFLWLLPPIVAHTPLLTWVVNGLASELKGEIRIGAASLGWFSAPQFADLEIRDERGEPVLAASSIVGERSLLAILMNRSNLGRFRCRKPQASVVLREDGSNLEEVLANYLADGPPPASLPSIVFEGEEGSVRVTNARTGQSVQIASWGMTLAMEKNGELNVVSSGSMAGGARGRLVGGVKARLSTTAKPGDWEEMVVEAEELPLEAFEPLVGRFVPDTRLVGRLSASLRCGPVGQQAARKMSIQGNATVNGIVLSMPPLGNDQAKLDRLYATCQMTWDAGCLQVDRISIESDLGSAVVTGVFKPGGGSLPEILESLRQETYSVNGQIDLARLAGILPETLRIQQDTQITSGEVRLSLASRPEAQGMSWQGRADVARLMALRGGRKYSWQQPILATFNARETAGRLTVEGLDCQSDFFKLHASGTPDAWEATADLQLSRLTEELAGFVDLGGLRLTGDGTAKVHWKRSASGEFETQGDLQVEEFQLAVPGRPAWTEESVRFGLSAAGSTDFRDKTRLDRASLEITAGPEWTSLRLREPAADLRRGTWPVLVEMKGDLARWSPRVSWLGLGDWSLGGAYQLHGEAVGSAAAVELTRSRLTVQDLEVGRGELNMREPRSELVLSGARWQPGARRVELASATLQGKGMSAEASRIVLSLPARGPAELRGSFHWQGALERMLNSTGGTGDEPPVWNFVGQFSGDASCEPASGGTKVQFDGVINNLLVVHRAEQVEEPNVRLVARGVYRPGDRLLEISQAELHSEALAMTIGGRYSFAGDRSDLHLDGKTDYDLEKLSAAVRTFFAEGFYMSGRSSSPVSYRGPLDLADGQGSVALQWTSADIYGFEVGPGHLRAALANRVLSVEPLDLDVSEGRMHLAPEVRFLEQGTELFVPAGKLIDQMRINPRMCTGAIQYIAPPLTGVATAEGRFSVALDKCRIPLDKPEAGDLAGRMTVHSVQVGPGPLTQQLALLMGRVGTAHLTRESTIHFHLADGRIHHRGMELQFADFIVRTYGSVGLDQTLAMTAEMPIPEKWVSFNPALKSILGNQVIRLPIAGTLQSPTIDRGEFERQSKIFLQDAAKNAIKNEIFSGLERLFGPQE